MLKKMQKWQWGIPYNEDDDDDDAYNNNDDDDDDEEQPENELVLYEPTAAHAGTTPVP